MTQDFSSAYETHVWQVYGFFAYRLGGQRGEAEDLTQLTFERAYRAWGRYDPDRAAVNTWLLAIARNLLIDHHRSGRSDRERPLDAVSEDDARLVHEDTADLGLAPELEDALAALGDRERELLALRFGGDLSNQQIAELTGLTLANVQQIMSRSLRGMRATLEASRDADADASGEGVGGRDRE